MAPLFPQKNGSGKHCDERLAQKENSMKSKIAPGTSERLPWQILLFSLPLMASNVLQVLFNMADIAVIGRFAGSLSMAAVGSTATAVTLFTGILIGVGGGINLQAAVIGGGLAYGVNTSTVLGSSDKPVTRSSWKKRKRCLPRIRIRWFWITEM